MSAANAGVRNALSPQQVARYRADGFLFPVPAIGPGRAAAVRAQLQAFEAAQGGSCPREMLLKPHLLLPWLHEVVSHPAILDAVESLLGPDLLCWSSRLFLKEPGDGGFIAWHQDVTHYGLEVMANIVTAWVAVTPAMPANGVMKVIPGSHTRLVRHQKGAKSSMLVRGHEIAVEVDEAKAVHMTLAAGEMSLHHGLIFHASDENRSDDRRIGFAIRYIPTSVRQLPDLPRDYATLVRGVDRFGHFDLERPPVAALDAAALEQHRAVSARWHEIHDLTMARHERMTETA